MLPILAVMSGLHVVYLVCRLMKNGVDVFVDMPKDADRKEPIIARSMLTKYIHSASSFRKKTLLVHIIIIFCLSSLSEQSQG